MPGLPPALRFPAYRAFWLGSMASVAGYQTFQFSQIWLVHELTGSPLFLGYLGLALALPAIVLNLFGGVFADKLDKKILLASTQLLSAMLALAMATLTILDLIEPWHILVIASVSGVVISFDWPTREALYPHLVDRVSVTSAVALDHTIWGGMRMVVPALAGLVITYMGTGVALYASGGGFVIFALVIRRISVPSMERSRGKDPVRDLVAGLAFIRKNTIFAFLITTTLFFSYFGMTHMMLMPVFAVDILKVGADGQGLLLSASGVSAVVTAAWLSSLGTHRHRGLFVIGGAAMAGLSTVAFALTSELVGSFYLALALMFVGGFFSTAFIVSVASSVQAMVPDAMRGRVMSMHGLTYHMFSFGAMQAGATANLIGAPLAVAIGGLAVVAFALGPALMNPRIRNLSRTVERGEGSKPPPLSSDVRPADAAHAAESGSD